MTQVLWDLLGLAVLAVQVAGPAREDRRTRRVRRGGTLRTSTLLAGAYAAVGAWVWHLGAMLLVAWLAVWLLVVVPFVVLFARSHVGGADVRYVAGPLVLTGVGLGPLGLVWVPGTLFATSLAQLAWRLVHPAVRSFAFIAWAAPTGLALAAALWVFVLARAQ